MNEIKMVDHITLNEPPDEHITAVRKHGVWTCNAAGCDRTFNNAEEDSAKGPKSGEVEVHVTEHGGLSAFPRFRENEKEVDV